MNTTKLVNQENLDFTHFKSIHSLDNLHAMKVQVRLGLIFEVSSYLLILTFMKVLAISNRKLIVLSLNVEDNITELKVYNLKHRRLI